MNLLPSSSSESVAFDEPRFHLKLRNGLFDRSCERRPIFNEPPLVGVRGDDADDNGVPRLPSNPKMPSTQHNDCIDSIAVIFFSYECIHAVTISI